MNQNQLSKILPRLCEYDGRTYDGMPAIEGLADNNRVEYWCPRCHEIHSIDRIALPGELYRTVEPCDKDSIGDIWVFYNFEIVGDQRLIRRLRRGSGFEPPVHCA